MLLDQIDLDVKAAIKEKNTLKVGALRMLKAAIKNKMIEKRTESLPDEAVLELIQKLMKQGKDSIAQFKKGNRLDLVDKETKEVAIFEHYLPQQLSESELKQLIQEAVHVTGAQKKSDIGKVMREVMPRIKGRAEGKRINEIASQLLE